MIEILNLPEDIQTQIVEQSIASLEVCIAKLESIIDILDQDGAYLYKLYRLCISFDIEYMEMYRDDRFYHLIEILDIFGFAIGFHEPKFIMTIISYHMETVLDLYIGDFYDMVDYFLKDPKNMIIVKGKDKPDNKITLLMANGYISCFDSNMAVNIISRHNPNMIFRTSWDTWDDWGL